MKDIKIVDDFVPKGSSKSEGPAITIGAGVQLPEMYQAVAKRNRTVIAGSAHTVGAAGGYIQGGGHSPFGHWKGLASDNALEFQVVTADVSTIHNGIDENVVLAWFKLNHISRALSSPQTHTKTKTFSGR
jgi:FAD/FMN-containing dehydrogenase